MNNQLSSTLYSPNHNGGGAESDFRVLSRVKEVYLLRSLAILVCREAPFPCPSYKRFIFKPRQTSKKTLKC